jgi:glutathionyl-hydroquinone reductase
MDDASRLFTTTPRPQRQISADTRACPAPRFRWKRAWRKESVGNARLPDGAVHLIFRKLKKFESVISLSVIDRHCADRAAS